MPSFSILIPVLLPFVTGAVLLIFPKLTNRARNTAIFIESLVNLALVLLVVLKGPDSEFVLFRLLEGLNIAFRPDGAGRFFAVMVSVLWPLTLLYGFEYMEDEERQGKFFGFFMMTYGITLGIAFRKSKSEIAVQIMLFHFDHVELILESHLYVVQRFFDLH